MIMCVCVRIQISCHGFSPFISAPPCMYVYMAKGRHRRGGPSGVDMAEVHMAGANKAGADTVGRTSLHEANVTGVSMAEDYVRGGKGGGRHGWERIWRLAN